MKQVYIQYWYWEDYQNGMWRKVGKDEEGKYFEKVLAFTSDHIKYGNAMKVVIKKWANTMLNSLTNKSINKRAFLGHCACSYKLNCPEYITRMAWKHLTNKQRSLADMVAQKTIDKWLINYEQKLLNTYRDGSVNATNTEYQTRLQLN